MFSIKTLYIIVFLLVNCNGKKYDRHSLLVGIPISENELDFFNKLRRNYNVNYWRRPGSLFKSVEFSIGPTEIDKLKEDAKKRYITLYTGLHDIQREFDNQMVSKYVRNQIHTFNWDKYYGFDDIVKWLEDLQRTHPDKLTLHNIGFSTEGRAILALKLKLPGPEKRPIVVVEGGIHAREWISPAFVTYMINEILHAPQSNDTQLKEIAFEYEWIFVPILNPDGYDYTHKTDRLWRKNRRFNFGVDLNRNFDIEFGLGDASNDTDSDTYCGIGPFSEPETKAFSEFMSENSKNLKYYLAFHSYGQHIIIPYAFTNKHRDNYEELKQISENVAEHISRSYGTGYVVGNRHETVGSMSSGCSGDWVKRTFKVPYVATFELRDTGKFGFALPSDEILPTCQETMEGLYVFLKVQNNTIDRNKINELQLLNYLRNRHDRRAFPEMSVIFLSCCLNLYRKSIKLCSF